MSSFIFFWFAHFLDVQAEIRKQFRRFFGGIEDKKKNLLRFPDLYACRLDPLKMLLRFSEARHQIYVSCLVRICLCWVLCISYEWFFKWDECKSSEKPCLSVFVCRPTEPSKGKLCQGVLTNFITSHLLPLSSLK